MSDKSNIVTLNLSARTGCGKVCFGGLCGVVVIRKYPLESYVDYCAECSRDSPLTVTGVQRISYPESLEKGFYAPA